MKLKMIAMLAVASFVALFSTSCDKDDDEETTECPFEAFAGEYNGKLVASATMGGTLITLPASDLTVTIKADAKDAEILVLGIGASTGNGMTINAFDIPDLAYMISEDVLTILPNQEFTANDGNYELTGTIENCEVKNGEMTLSYKVKPGKAPMLNMEFTTVVAE